LIRELQESNYNLRIAAGFRSSVSTPPVIDREIIDAVKYAMVHAHPDKGGNSADFIRFHELHEKIKKYK
jgi:hypothetical protein